MSLQCTRCDGTGFLNLEQVPERLRESEYWVIEEWLNDTKESLEHDVSICDCCGNTELWYGLPGEHYNNEDPSGPNGPYAYNGGLCKCN